MYVLLLGCTREFTDLYATLSRSVSVTLECKAGDGVKEYIKRGRKSSQVKGRRERGRGMRMRMRMKSI